MADKKISQLTTLAQADVAVTADFLPIVDTSATETKKATPQSVVLGALGATSANVGIGTASPAARLQVKSSAAQAVNIEGTTARGGGNIFAAFLDPTGRKGYFGYGSASDDGFYLYNEMNSPMVFATNNTERMRLDSSGNLGIGTASPGARLDVQAPLLDIAGVSTTGTNYVRQRMTNTGGDFYYGIDSSTGSNFGFAYAAVLWYTGNNSMVFGTNNSRRMEIDGSGNVMTGGGNIGTAATNGFLYVPTCAGTPTGTPTAKTGYAPIVVNTTNNKLYFYSGGAWRDAGP